MATQQRLVVVGGVAGGATAAARARRLNQSLAITVFEKGPHVSFANCGLPYFVGHEIQKQESLLLQTPKSLHLRYALDVRTSTEVVRIDRQRKIVCVKDFANNREYEEPYHQLILAPGGEAIRPPIPGIDGPKVVPLRSVPDAEKMERMLNNAQNALVIGGGFIGLETVEQIRNRGVQCTLVELSDQVMPPADKEMVQLLNHELISNEVDLLLGDAVAALEPYNPEDPEGAVKVRLRSGTVLNKPFDLAVLAVGVRPNIALAKDAGLAVGRGILVDPFLRTSDPDIFAIGDAIEVKNCVLHKSDLIPLAGPANKQARIAATNAVAQLKAMEDPSLKYEPLKDYRCSLGTSIVRVFGKTLALTGASEKALIASGTIPYSKCYVHAPNHASYYPGAGTLSIKLLFNPRNKIVLGAQIIGPSSAGAGVDKRIDVIATAIHGNMTVTDLEELELAYSPPFGSAKDPINIAGFVAENIMLNQDPMINSEALASMLAQTANNPLVIIDVRTPEEFSAGHIPGAINIPVDELRDWLASQESARLLEQEKQGQIDLVVYCKAGLRGYVATQQILQHGANRVRNLNGGYISWNLSQGRGDLAQVLLA
jgi:NADPH-dependent 2,4-dienoyl-CoA reductase/sulfur reductase-like enzyme/rhodanese-related sulfurtransferase